MAAVTITSTLDFAAAISKDVVKANDAAITYTAAKVLTQFRAMLPGLIQAGNVSAGPQKRPTGEMESELGIKFFKGKNKLRGAAIKVIGERYRASAILEKGTRNGHIKPHRMFEKAALQMESTIMTLYTDTFFKTLEQLGGQ